MTPSGRPPRKRARRPARSSRKSSPCSWTPRTTAPSGESAALEEDSTAPQGFGDGKLQAFAQTLLSNHFEIHPAGEQSVDHVRVPLDGSALTQHVVDLDRGH